MAKSTKSAEDTTRIKDQMVLAPHTLFPCRVYSRNILCKSIISSESAGFHILKYILNVLVFLCIKLTVTLTLSFHYSPFVSCCYNKHIKRPFLNNKAALLPLHWSRSISLGKSGNYHWELQKKTNQKKKTKKNKEG